MDIIQVVGFKNAGKTTLVRELVRAFSGEGSKVGTLKSDPHDHDPEPVGTDTRLHREAGASVTAFASPSRTAWVEEHPTSLEDLVEEMAKRGVDVLVVEGFKTAPYPKIALIRREEDAELLDLPNTIAIATRAPLPPIESRAERLGIARFHLPDTESFGPIVAFLLDRTRSDRVD
ncbi:molybdopterin-guanine dinucleotide biosynthesis protein B [Cohnella suwonensis]|uniref:Molybdopterin-guanine dinucleotide biosynthesis protein B n=1 Tax=Cohnella suwonensis TaxID=696072 RepID=A0ABW0M0R5_9BACL